MSFVSRRKLSTAEQVCLYLELCMPAQQNCTMHNGGERMLGGD